MDRVVCCYPSFRPLLDAAISHARRTLAHSYPRDRWYVRLGIWFNNFNRRLRRNPFRTFVHPPAEMHTIASQQGFRLKGSVTTRIWCIEVWERSSLPENAH